MHVKAKICDNFTCQRLRTRLRFLCYFYVIISLSELDENKGDDVEIARDTIAVQQLLTHVPDIVINCDHEKRVPFVEQFKGVCLFADISGNKSCILLVKLFNERPKIVCVVKDSIIVQDLQHFVRSIVICQILMVEPVERINSVPL